MTAKVETHIPIQDLTKNISLEDKCNHCNGSKCCQYTTIQIDTPRSIREFDNLLWQVSHINTHIFKDSDGWYLLLYEKCQHLQPSGQCGIYEKRPFVCREHDNKECEFDYEFNEGTELYFVDYESFDNFCRQKFKSWDKRFSTSK
ncbi:MAG: YkgJ family cysteine cluster protein [Kangiellaceae bacterium]|nr:YkgJ family cysteine cluster protein [Kangiellaceae bacterium]